MSEWTKATDTEQNHWADSHAADFPRQFALFSMTFKLPGKQMQKNLSWY